MTKASICPQRKTPAPRKRRISTTAPIIEDDMIDDAFQYGDDFDEEIDSNDDDFVDSLGMDLDDDLDTTDEDSSADAASEDALPSVTADQVEKALENVIERMFAEKIEALFDGSDRKKPLPREIEKLKNSLLHDTARDV